MMYKIALLTNTLSKPGGAEYLTISMFSAINSLNNNITTHILGREKHLDIDALRSWLSDDELVKELLMKYKYANKFPFNINELLKYDLIVNTKSNEVIAPAHIHYLHWIFSPYGIKDPEALAFYKESYSIGNNMTENIKWIIKHFINIIQLKMTKLILANSTYVARLLKDLSINAKVLYPPTRSREIMAQTLSTWNDKDRIVITTARIDSGKQLEYIPLIASKIPHVKFILIGSLANKNYYIKLLKIKKLLNAENFIIIPNVPRHELYSVLKRAMIYLHTARHEPFGIAVVEGMAAGCIPIVHRSGGPYHDILGEKDGVYGYSYQDIEDAVNLITEIMSNKHKYRDISERARVRSLKFDESLFRKRVQDLIKSMIS